MKMLKKLVSSETIKDGFGLGCGREPAFKYAEKNNEYLKEQFCMFNVMLEKTVQQIEGKFIRACDKARIRDDPELKQQVQDVVNEYKAELEKKAAAKRVRQEEKDAEARLKRQELASLEEEDDELNPDNLLDSKFGRKLHNILRSRSSSSARGKRSVSSTRDGADSSMTEEERKEAERVKRRKILDSDLTRMSDSDDEGSMPRDKGRKRLRTVSHSDEEMEYKRSAATAASVIKALPPVPVMKPADLTIEMIEEWMISQSKKGNLTFGGLATGFKFQGIDRDDKTGRITIVASNVAEEPAASSLSILKTAATQILDQADFETKQKSASASAVVAPQAESKPAKLEPHLVSNAVPEPDPGMLMDL
jgi:hypothetical protein